VKNENERIEFMLRRWPVTGTGDDNVVHDINYASQAKQWHDRAKKLEAETKRLKARVVELEDTKIIDGMKADCMGEFSITISEFDYESRKYIKRKVLIDWTMTKDIYKMMHESKLRHLKATQRPSPVTEGERGEG